MVKDVACKYTPLTLAISFCVGRRGTNQLRLLQRYLDILVELTTEIPPPTALVEVRP